MNITHFLADQATGALTEVPEAANAYYDSVRGLTVRQQFFVYPNDAIVAVDTVDGGSTVRTLYGDDAVIFQHRHPAYFCAA